MRCRFDKSRNFRQGFTLFELLLVLGLLVMIGALAWPSIQRAYEGIRLKKAAEQVMAAFGHARVLAMTTGVSQAFRFEPGSGQYTMTAVQDDSAAVDADTTGSASATAGPTSPGASSTTTDPNADLPAASSANPNGMTSGNAAGACAYQLADGFAFAKGERVLDARAALTESELPGNGSSDNGSSENAPPVLFYPDGTTSEAVVTVSDKSGRSISVSLRGLTGVARMGDIFIAEAAQ